MAIATQMDEDKSSVLEAIKSRALQTSGPFRLASGKTSNYFLDMKAVLTDGGVLRKIARLVLERTPLDATAIGGLAMGSIPISTAVVLLNEEINPRRRLHSFWVRPAEKTHGLGGLISGTVGPYDRVVIIDDVTTEGNSVLKAIAAVQKEKAKILKVIAIVDRQEGATERLSRQGFQLEPLFTRDQILGS